MPGRGRGWVRVWTLRVHMVAGLTVGLILALLGVSGSALVFREEIDALLHPELVQVEPRGERIPAQRAVELVRRAYPDAPPVRIRAPRAPEESYVVTLRGGEGRLVFVDPYRARILGSRGGTETVTGFLFAWHSTLLGGETGKWALGVVALLLLVLVATGLVVWWPGIRRLRDAFLVRQGGSWKRTNYDLHRAGGIWSTAFLVAMAITGASLIFHEAFLSGLNRLTRSSARPSAPVVTPRPGAEPLPLDLLGARATRALGGGSVTYITLPGGPTAPVTVRARFEGELHPNGRSFVYLDPSSGEVLAVENARHAPLGWRAYNVLYPIHVGRWGGTASRVLHVALGLSPLLLFVSGVLIWLNRQRRPRPARERPLRRGRSDPGAVLAWPDRSGQTSAKEGETWS